MGTCGCSPGGTGRSAGRRGGGGRPAAGARPWAGAGGTRGPPECSSLRPGVPAVPAPPRGAAPVIRPGDTDVTSMVSLYPHLHSPTAFLLCPSVPVPPRPFVLFPHLWYHIYIPMPSPPCLCVTHHVPVPQTHHVPCPRALNTMISCPSAVSPNHPLHVSPCFISSHPVHHIHVPESPHCAPTPVTLSHHTPVSPGCVSVPTLRTGSWRPG